MNNNSSCLVRYFYCLLPPCHTRVYSLSSLTTSTHCTRNNGLMLIYSHRLPEIIHALTRLFSSVVCVILLLNDLNKYVSYSLSKREVVREGWWEWVHKWGMRKSISFVSLVQNPKVLSSYEWNEMIELLANIQWMTGICLND